jgi:UDP-N-acetyl-D-galactosamine dehydrogenase
LLSVLLLGWVLDPVPVIILDFPSPPARISPAAIMTENLAHLTAPDTPLAIIGLGYVGLPLAVEFGQHRPVVGFDINAGRIAELQAGHDGTREVTPAALAAARQLRITHDLEALRACRIFIVTVPTPVDEYKRPDLTPLLKASATVGQVLKPGDLVIYESTVYPGCTEDDCAPVLERVSGLKYLSSPSPQSSPRAGEGLGERGHEPQVFHLGYSPERINPGDHDHRLTTIKKVTSGSSPEIAAIVDALYRQIIVAGTHPASSIRVAEAAKVIENTQRDLNIALMNELALIFGRLGIDTLEVLEAAGSKWNFLPFRPGLVGGHCIGVDPYYLTHKAIAIGYHPEVILAGRRINDRMGAHVAETVVKLMLGHGIGVCNSRILVLGLSFKENCPDLRNTRVIDIIDALRDYSIAVDCFDPWVDRAEAKHEYGIDCLPALPAPGGYDAVILAVAHRDFTEMGAEALRALGKVKSILYDVKSILPAAAVDGRL